jgi:hypothetical protein
MIVHLLPQIAQIVNSMGQAACFTPEAQFIEPRLLKEILRLARSPAEGAP